MADNPLLGGYVKGTEELEVEDAETKRLTKLKNLRDDWLRSTDRKIQANAIRSQVQGILAQNELALEARRARLYRACNIHVLIVYLLSQSYCMQHDTSSHPIF